MISKLQSLHTRMATNLAFPSNMTTRSQNALIFTMLDIGRHSLQKQMQSFVHNMVIHGKLSKVDIATKTKIVNLQARLNIIFDFENILKPNAL